MSGGAVRPRPALLLVDDEPNILHALQRLLRRDGYRILTAESGAEGLAVMAREEVAVVVSDQRMPAMTGVEFLSQVRVSFPDTVRIILSGYADFNAVASAINDGAVYKFLTKPWDDELLRANIGDAFQRYVLIDEREQFSKVYENTKEGVMITDAAGYILSVNPAFTSITGYTQEEVVGQTAQRLASGRHDEAFFRDFWEQLERRGQWHGEIWNCRKDGTLYPQWTTVAAIHDNNARVVQYVTLFTDVSERKEYEKKIEFQAYHDALTGLPNRLQFAEQLDMALTRARRERHQAAVLLCDLDRFKVINDTLGHDTGDRLLHVVAGRLAGCVERDQIVARQGGDEFTVLLPEVRGADQARAVAYAMIEALRSPIEIAGQELFVSPSIGVALFPADGELPEILMKNADTAMYRAKEQGRNGCCFYAPSMNANAAARLVMEGSLHKAVQRHELMLFYQPQVRIGDGSVCGVEALARWRHTELGLVPPADFIPLAEEIGLIASIGEWTLQQACRDGLGWRGGDGRGLRVAVNLSARQIQQADLVSTVRQVLDESGFPAERLELELTEGVLMHEPQVAAQVLGELKAMGVTIAVDDFGTGYSSLSYIKRFPIDVLKIDQSFVRGVTDDPDDAAIVRAIIAMAHSLRLEVVAEGVEREAQWRFLRELGCEVVQGYLFARPMPGGELVRILEEGGVLTAREE